MGSNFCRGVKTTRISFPIPAQRKIPKGMSFTGKAAAGTAQQTKMVGQFV